MSAGDDWANDEPGDRPGCPIPLLLVVTLLAALAALTACDWSTGEPATPVTGVQPQPPVTAVAPSAVPVRP